MATGNALMNEIYDHFLVCKVCLEGYKTPKTLSCQHTFCKDCLAKHHETEQERSHGYRLQARSVSCPVCRKRTDLPVGGISRLSDNLLVSNLSEVVERRRTSKTKSTTDCDICRSTTTATTTGVRSRTMKDTQAHFRCLDCSKMLCRRCADLHRRTKVTQDHGLFDVEVKDKDVQCRIHSEETIRFYCEACEECICVLCTFQQHKDHEVYTFTEGIERHGHCLDTLLERSRGRCGRLREQLDLINRCEASIKVAEECIRETAMDWIRQIRQQERQILRELEEIFSEKARKFIQQKETLQETLQALENTCSLTEIVIKDRSVELLMLKNEINLKLNKLLTDGKILPPPDVVTQPVTFVSGTCLLGNLEYGGKGCEEPALVTQPQQMTKTKRTESCSSSSSCCSNKEMSALLVPAQCKKNSEEPRVETENNKCAKNIISSRVDQSDYSAKIAPDDDAFRIQTKTYQNDKGKEKSQSGFFYKASFRLQSKDGCTSLCRKPVSSVDRSTAMTGLLDSQCDKVLDTTGLICTKDGSTQSQRMETQTIGIATDTVLKVNKFTFTTNKSSFLTNTASARRTSMLDMEEAAKIGGSRKATSAKAILTVDQSTSTDDKTMPEERGNDANQCSSEFHLGAIMTKAILERGSDESSSIGRGDTLTPNKTSIMSENLRDIDVTTTAIISMEDDSERTIADENIGVDTKPFLSDTTTNTALVVHKYESASQKLLERTETGTSVMVHKQEGSCEMLPERTETGTNTTVMVHKYEGSSQNLPVRTETGTNTEVMEDKNEGSCEMLPERTETGTNTEVMEDKNEGSCEMLPERKENSTNIVLAEEENGRLWLNLISNRAGDSEITTITKRETGREGPPRSLVDRASSPVRFSGIDKAVSASRGEIAEPVDTFQTPGKHKKLLQAMTACGPKLDSICEGSNESSSSDEEQSQSKAAKCVVGPLPTRHRLTDRNVSWDDRKRGILTHRERFAPSFGSTPQGRPTTSTFSVEGQRSACSIVWKVEMGTNTACVELHDKATGTDSPLLETKMAECISKLKTVRQRLETKQTSNSSTSMSISKESADMTTSASSVETAAPTIEEISLPQTPAKPLRDKFKLRHRILSSPQKQRRTSAEPEPESSLSESSDQEQETRTHPLAPNRRPSSFKCQSPMARKQRVDVNDMLRSPSASFGRRRSPKLTRKSLQTSVSSSQN